jgi:hypothetical protein
MLIVQVGLLFHARNVAEQAAQEGTAAGRRFDGSAAQAEASTYRYLGSLSDRTLQDRSVHVNRTNQTTTVTVSGKVISLVPWLDLRPQRERVRIGTSRTLCPAGATVIAVAPQTGPAQSGLALPRRRPCEKGMAAIELVLLAPVLLLILMFVVGLGRMAHARQQVESVAADSARAASLERGADGSATAAAQSAARRSLGEAGVSCTDLAVHVDLSRYRPGGSVAATVSCRAELGDVAIAGFPGSKVFTATAVVPIESYRSR